MANKRNTLHRRDSDKTFRCLKKRALKVAASKRPTVGPKIDFMDLEIEAPVVVTTRPKPRFCLTSLCGDGLVAVYQFS